MSKLVTVMVGPPGGTSVLDGGGVLVSGAELLNSGCGVLSGSVDSIWPVVGALESGGVAGATGTGAGAATAPSGTARSASDTASKTLTRNTHPPRDFNALLPRAVRSAPAYKPLNVSSHESSKPASVYPNEYALLHKIQVLRLSKYLRGIAVYVRHNNHEASAVPSLLHHQEQCGAAGLREYEKDRQRDIERKSFSNRYLIEDT
jgi:hypothetical protein